ncbi:PENTATRICOPEPTIDE REPEAT-CONTAINING PROTEIN [Salix purpurea]|uniref:PENTATRICOPEPTIDE REPEAT-CONTAINING PROTEIN n=1 Tax=Salix purpurea TaxID=77065 RepID=A0A9Q0QHL8_SALPP|nr:PENTATRICOPEPTIDE REPEAT-CONTAINING PROTEIN [Salix purpurea]
MFKGFTRSVALQFGRELHCHVVKYGLGSNVFAHNALINMYALCGLIDMARGIFDMSCKSDVVTWNAMMSGYNRIKKYDEARKLFDMMEEKRILPSSVTLVSVLSVCSKLKGFRMWQAACGEMNVALGIFKNMKKRDVISWTAIVTGFVNTGQVDEARKYFHKMPERDHVSWTAMIDGYLRFNCYKEALMLFREMQTSKIKPDEFTMVSILTACAQLGALELGEWIRTYIDKNKVKSDTFVGNALIDMYFKCGNVDKALSIFNGMPQRDKFTWTAMVIGLAINV